MASRFFICSLVLLSLAVSCYGEGLFSDLKKTLTLEASPTSGQVVKAGEDKIKVTWGFNQSFPAGTDSTYTTLKVKLCFAPISQKERAWRKTEEELKKDRTCQFTLVTRAYDSSKNALQTFEGVVKRDVPTASYFVRVYAYDSHEHEKGYGQTTDEKHSINVFIVQGITGRHATLDICAGVFSAFSVITLFAFFYKEKRKGSAEKS